MLFKKAIIVLLSMAGAAAVITAAVVLLPLLSDTPDSATPPGETTTTGGGRDMAALLKDGTYEGETDASGKRSGYGVWIYHNFRYEGYFENDMPNGEGTLYEAGTPPESRESGKTYLKSTIVAGHWVDGFTDGEIKLTWIMESGERLTWSLNTEKGCTLQDGKVYTADGRTDLNVTKDWLVGGVPPWADVSTDPEVEPPVADVSTDPEIEQSQETPDSGQLTPDNTSEPASPDPDDSLTAANSTEAETVSADGARYRSARCEFSLPDGLVCSGTIRVDDATLALYPGPTMKNGPLYLTQWIKTADDTGLESGSSIIGIKAYFNIMEFDTKISDFESDTRTAEEWYDLQFWSTDGAEGAKSYNRTNIQAERRTVDGCPAVRVSWVTKEAPNPNSYEECWVIDTPVGYTVIELGYVKLSWDEGEHKEWVEGLMSSVKVDK